MSEKSSPNNLKNSSGANLGFEQKLWQAADKLRSNMDAAEYKHVVIGLIFLKCIKKLILINNGGFKKWSKK
nr:type I restriction-modification system subunit M N-terminal domain-containing protein [Fervidobacterium sp.]